jgi:hypothetical protein
VANKRIKEKMESTKKDFIKLTYSIVQDAKGFCGSVKDEKGRLILQIFEDEDYNQLSRLIHTSKYMSGPKDTKGLANYIWERGLVTVTKEDKAFWDKKKVIPIEITLV